MTAQEVWKAWKKDKSLMFKCNLGEIYYNTKELSGCWKDDLRPVHIHTFMGKDWEPVEETLLEINFQEAMVRASTGQVVRVLDESRNTFFNIKEDSQLTPYVITKYRYFIKELNRC